MLVKMWQQTVVFSVIVCYAFAAISIGPLEPKPKKFESVEGCYISQLDTVVPFGKSAPSKTSCMEYRCGKTMVQYVMCGSVGASPPCYTVKDESKPYPDCCPKIVCH